MTEERQRIFPVDKQAFVTKGFYRNVTSYCSFYIDCDVLGRMYFLDDVVDQYTKSVGTYFSEKYVSFNIG